MSEIDIADKPYNANELYGVVLSGKDIEVGGRQVLFDKIINLKFIRRDSKTGKDNSFTLRSDWELFIQKDNTYTFNKCLMKPEIRVEYQRVSDNTAIRIQIYVTNLHLQSAMQQDNGKVWESFSYNNNPITHVQLQLGYFNQFPDFGNPANSLTSDDYYNLKTKSFKREYTEIMCQVLSISPIRTPPDGQTLFDCVVGNIGNSYHTDQGVIDKTTKFGKDTTIEDYFFEMITRRFLREYMDPAKVQIDKSEASSFAVDDIDGKRKLIRYIGPMTARFAREHGVRCYLTDTAKDAGFTSKGNNVKVINPIPQRDNVNSAFYEMSNMFPMLRFTALPTGDYIVYHQTESASQVANTLVDLKVNEPVKGLPAIYSITYSGLRTIKCPFTSVVKPFQELSFSSRYNIGNLVGYFYSPRPGYERFIVINYKVNFSTTGDENEMELLSTDSNPTQGD
jgi:hypothetical protein